MRFLFIIILGLLFTSCQKAVSQNQSADTNTNINSSYWNDGLAEINHYDLKQIRYGEERQGDLVQIFVTEDFLLNKQVKNESNNSKNSTRVLKRIETRKFNTGIYEYSMFSSAFTPFDYNRYPHSIKVSSSSQEWCGNTYSQLNKTNSGYDYTLHSYFENEADRKTKIPEAISEEELFTRIRMNPDLLPLGKFKLIPSQIISRFLHLDAEAFKSTAHLQAYNGNEFDGESLLTYAIETPGINRSLEIVFEKSAPYTIVGWTDSYSSYFSKERRKTVAKLTHQIKEAYWQYNSNKDQPLRAKLGME